MRQGRSMVGRRMVTGWKVARRSRRGWAHIWTTGIGVDAVARTMARRRNQLIGADADGHHAVAAIRLVGWARGIARGVVGRRRILDAPVAVRAGMMMVVMRRRRTAGVARIVLGGVHTFGGNRRGRPMGAGKGMARQTFGDDPPRRLTVRRRRSMLVRRPWPRGRIRRSDLVRIQHPTIGSVERGICVVLTSPTGRRRDLHPGTRRVLVGERIGTFRPVGGRG